jgi:hypothetical protein
MVARHVGHDVKETGPGGLEIRLPAIRYPTAHALAGGSTRSQAVEIRGQTEGRLERNGGKGVAAVVEALAGIRREVAAQMSDLKSDLTGLKIDLNAQTTALTAQTKTVTALAGAMSKLFVASEEGKRLQGEQQQAVDEQSKMIEALTKRLDAQGLGGGKQDREGSPAARTRQ